MSPTNCWNLRVTAEVNQGGRRYMEDVTAVQFERAKVDKKVVEYAAFAIFDGHGGKEAAHFARDHILENIKKQKGFFSKDVETVKKAICDGFVTTHQQMWNELPKWPKTSNGHPSTAGTTASLVLIRGNKMYVANVGDSMVVMGTREFCYRNNPRGFQAMELTVDHKPELPEERKRIELCGGLVMNKAGVNRVVWNRPKLSHNGPIRRSTKLDKIPFLAIARSLGDLWSYNSEQNEFIVSPIPDVHAYDLHHEREQFIVLASDGLWNMVRPYESVTSAGTFEERKQKKLVTGTPAHELVQLALDRWNMRAMRADNTSVIVVYIERKKMESNTKKRDTYSESWTSARLEGSTRKPDDNDMTNDENNKSSPQKKSVKSEEVNAQVIATTSAADVESTNLLSVSSHAAGCSTAVNSISPKESKEDEPLQDCSISSSSGEFVDETLTTNVMPNLVRSARGECFATLLNSPSTDKECDEPSSSSVETDQKGKEIVVDGNNQNIVKKMTTRKNSRDLKNSLKRDSRSSKSSLLTNVEKKVHKRRKSEEIETRSAKNRKVVSYCKCKMRRTSARNTPINVTKPTLGNSPNKIHQTRRPASAVKAEKDKRNVLRRKSEPVMHSVGRNTRARTSVSPMK